MVLSAKINIDFVQSCHILPALDGSGASVIKTLFYHFSNKLCTFAADDKSFWWWWWWWFWRKRWKLAFFFLIKSKCWWWWFWGKSCVLAFCPFISKTQSPLLPLEPTQEYMVQHAEAGDDDDDDDDDFEDDDVFLTDCQQLMMVFGCVS